jgi:hypothetical protein
LISNHADRAGFSLQRIKTLDGFGKRLDKDAYWAKALAMASNPKSQSQTSERTRLWVRIILMVLVACVGIAIIVGLASLAPREKALVCDAPEGSATSLIGFGGCHTD